MKLIVFEGKKYEVPDWVNWVAKDDDGEISGYESNPHQSLNGYWYSSDGRAPYNLSSKSSVNWKESLTKV